MGQKCEDMRLTLGKKEAEVQDLSKTIAELKQSYAAISEKEKEISNLQSKLEDMTLKQKSATEEKIKLESENKMLNERVSKSSDMEKAIESTKETMAKEINAQKEAVH